MHIFGFTATRITFGLSLKHCRARKPSPTRRKMSSLITGTLRFIQKILFRCTCGCYDGEDPGLHFKEILSHCRLMLPGRHSWLIFVTGWAKGEGRKERKIRDAYKERGNFHRLYSSYYASILPSDDAILHVGTCPQCDHWYIIKESLFVHVRFSNMCFVYSLTGCFTTSTGMVLANLNSARYAAPTFFVSIGLALVLQEKGE
jgi:hypothetical protein